MSSGFPEAWLATEVFITTVGVAYSTPNVDSYLNFGPPPLAHVILNPLSGVRMYSTVTVTRHASIGSCL